MVPVHAKLGEKKSHESVEMENKAEMQKNTTSGIQHGCTTTLSMG